MLRLRKCCFICRREKSENDTFFESDTFMPNSKEQRKLDAVTENKFTLGANSEIIIMFCHSRVN